MSKNFYLRTESIKLDEILSLSVIDKKDQEIIDSLVSPEPCLVEGSRGTGKSFLMRLAELEVEKGDSNNMAVFVSFNVSSLVSTSDVLQFYHWMLAKTLRALLNKLRKSGYQVSPYSTSLLSNDEINETEELEQDLKSLVKGFEESYKGNNNINTSNLPDIEDVKEAIESICIDNNIQRLYFFFDEAAHVFRPSQQRQFFSLFKDLRSPYITCNAAIYPGVTYFGPSFEPIHDCIFRKLDRSIKDDDYLNYYTSIVFKQADDQLTQQINKQKNLFNTLVFCCGGNPRMLLKNIQDLSSFNNNNVNSLIKDFYRSKIWTEHTELGDKYNGHRDLIDWGRDFLEKDVVPNIQKYNSNRKNRGQSESTVYFWIHKDSPETVNEALRLLTYTGIIRKVDTAVRATRAELGARYEVKYGCILSLENNPVNESANFYTQLSIKKFPEFGKNHSAYNSLGHFDQSENTDFNYADSLRNMLSKPITVLQVLTDWQKNKLNEAGIITLEDLHSNTETDLIEKMYNVGTHRARIMKNAANAELLEYLSG